MNEVTLPPSPNWYLNSILACAKDGTIAWGSRNSIVIAKESDNLKQLNYSIIEKAHIDRVTCFAFSPTTVEDNGYLLVSGGDDNIVKIWNLRNLNIKLQNSYLDNRKVIGVDWSKPNPNLICFITDTGLLVTWNIDYDSTQSINFGKLNATCIACCPHDSNIVSIGSKIGLIYIVDISGSGNIKYKLRGHDVEIVSLSWCPVPINIFNENNSKDLLLASGAKDRVIYLWKAGSDGRYQTQITLPNSVLDSSNHKTKINTSTINYTAVNWLMPTILLTSSPWGELLMWDLTENAKKKKFTPTLIHAKHSKGLFTIAGLVEESIEECENDKNVNWRTKMNIKAIWTIAQDRQVICCNILNNKPVIKHSVPTQGGFVYCISACPIDTSQIAIGVGDAMIRLWNLSEPHENIIELQILWEKIKAQVRSLSWHPEKENILAFATNEGRVGSFDLNTKKPPTIYRQYHRHIIYRIGWGPAVNSKEYALYTCGDGELVYYNPEKFNDVPISVIKKKECTDFCWKSDDSLLALGFIDGSVSFLNHDLVEYGETIHLLNKAVQCLAWHPVSTSSDLSISPMENYLAVGINGPQITIFEIYPRDSKEYSSDDSLFYKIVATLNAHTEKVVCLAWSPHISGYLVSGSYDQTAQVWKVETQEVIATYISHLAPIQCCMWSPFSQDLILTGSVDFTLRTWSISKQKVLVAPIVTKPLLKQRQRTKKKKKVVVNNSNEIEIELEKKLNKLEIIIDNEQKITKQIKNSEETTTINKNSCKIIKKKKTKKATRFPGYAELVNNNKLWCSSIKNLVNTLQNNSNTDESVVFNCSEADNISNQEGKILSKNDYVLFGNKKNLEDALKHEKKLLNSNEQYNIATEIDLWNDNLKENLYEAMKNKRLNDFLVSLAPVVSIETWEKMCEAYAQQLLFEENPHKAVSYLLCINKVNQAINIFMSEKLYKEAYALASSRLDAKDPIIKDILTEWAFNAQNDGHFQNVTECYIKLGDYIKAAKVLVRRKDFHSLSLAIDLAEEAQDLSLSESLADKAVIDALCNYKIEAAKFIIEKHPQVQYRELEVELFNELRKILENVNDETIFNWLKGSSNVSLLETMGNSFTKSPSKYALLLQKDVFPLPVDEIMMQIHVSHQFALSVISEHEQQLQHIVKALDIILKYEKMNNADKENECSSLIIKYLFMLDKRIVTDPNSIFVKCENKISKSLRAYLCYAVINWFQECRLNESQISECLDFVLIIIEKCIEDLLNKESVRFWTTSDEIMKLETKLSSTIGNLKNNEGDSLDETKAIILALDQLKCDYKQFIDHQISSPNPFLSYRSIMKFIINIPNEQIREKMNEFITNLMMKATS